MSEQDHGQFLLRLQIICGALVGSVVIYVAVAWVVVQQGALGEVSEGMPAALPGALLVAAALMLIAANRVPRAMLDRATVEDGAGGTSVPMQAIQSAYIVGFALREAVAIFGLVLTFISGDLKWALMLSAVAVLAMVAGWPTRGRVESYLGRDSAPLEP